MVSWVSNVFFSCYPNDQKIVNFRCRLLTLLRQLSRGWQEESLMVWIPTKMGSHLTPFNPCSTHPKMYQNVASMAFFTAAIHFMAENRAKWLVSSHPKTHFSRLPRNPCPEAMAQTLGTRGATRWWYSVRLSQVEPPDVSDQHCLVGGAISPSWKISKSSMGTIEFRMTSYDIP